MPRFKILPADQSYSSAEIIALDAGAVLGIVDRLECHEADVVQDDTYAFSVRLGSNGMWTIFQRPEDFGSEELISYG